jgi:hypothetical protein
MVGCLAGKHWKLGKDEMHSQYQYSKNLHIGKNISGLALT